MYASYDTILQRYSKLTKLNWPLKMKSPVESLSRNLITLDKDDSAGTQGENAGENEVQDCGDGDGVGEQMRSSTLGGQIRRILSRGSSLKGFEDVFHQSRTCINQTGI